MPYDKGVESFELLKAAGVKATMKTYPGTWTKISSLSGAEIDEIKNFLVECLG